MAFLACAKSDGEEGRAFCARTADGGASWDFVGWMTPEYDGWSIMPSTVRLPGGRLVSAVRCRDKERSWLPVFASDDQGRSWSHLSEVSPDTGGAGNPAAMIALADGRLCCAYGVRNAPYGIRARLSEDGGSTWGREIILRADGGCWDLGYPRSVQRPDGLVVTAYYFNEHQSSERYIAATIWKP
jgi:hypothetical protein